MIARRVRGSTGGTGTKDFGLLRLRGAQNTRKWGQIWCR